MVREDSWSEGVYNCPYCTSTLTTWEAATTNDIIFEVANELGCVGLRIDLRED